MPIDDMLTAGDSVEKPWARGLPDGQKVLIGSPWQHHGPLCELVSSSSDWCVRMGRHAGDAPVKDCPPGLCQNSDSVLGHVLSLVAGGGRRLRVHRRWVLPL